MVVILHSYWMTFSHIFYLLRYTLLINKSQNQCVIIVLVWIFHICKILISWSGNIGLDTRHLDSVQVFPCIIWAKINKDLSSLTESFPIDKVSYPQFSILLLFVSILVSFAFKRTTAGAGKSWK